MKDKSIQHELKNHYEDWLTKTLEDEAAEAEYQRNKEYIERLEIEDRYDEIEEY